MKKLSILICTLKSRDRYLQRLMNLLKPQIASNGGDEGPVEICAISDEGQMAIGDKRNLLLEQAKGDYISFVDDDDRVAPNYVTKILQAIETNPDCVGMEGIITFDGVRPQKFIHSLRYKEWFEKGGIYYRNPNHLSPVKREFALKVKFPSLNMGEDHDYSKRLLPFLNTEVYIDGPIYFYDFRTVKDA